MPPLTNFNSQRPTSHIRLIAVMLVLAAIIWLGVSLSHTLSCFVLSYIIAYLLDPIVVKLEKRVKRGQAIILLYIALAIIFIFSVAFLLPTLTMNWDNFLRTLPQQLQKIKQDLHDWQASLPNHYGSDEVNWILDYLLGNADRVAEKGGVWVYNFATRMFFNLFNLVLAPILVFFMLSYKVKILDTIKLWLPDSRRKLILQIGTEIDKSVGGYLKGQVIVSTVVTLATIPVLFWLKVPNPVLCGILAGISSILPFIGVILAMLPPLILSWLAFGSNMLLIKIIIAFGVIYFLEGYLVKPLVFEESMNLNPLLTIIMVMAFGELMGFWGILLALPITAAILITTDHWLKGDFSSTEDES